MLQASLEFDLILILSVWNKQYWYELGGIDYTPVNYPDRQLGSVMEHNFIWSSV